MDNIRTGLSYGDALLVPQRSPVDSRSNVDLSTQLTPSIELETPLLSAPMDTVTEAETAIALSRAGGFGTIHRFMRVDEQVEAVERVADAGERCGAAVGIAEDTVSRAEAVLDAGASLVMVDVAHGHLERTLEAVSELRDVFPDAEIVAGNVATKQGVRDLAEAGADAVKVGIGPGSHCTTRRVAGAGVPQLTAVDDCSDAAASLDVSIIADGGIRTSGDAVKALMAGADTVMMGSLFAGTEEAPTEIVEVDGTRYKRSRGMATTAANEKRSDKETDAAAPDADEGVEALTEYKGQLVDVAGEFAAGIRSGLSYVGGHTIEQARERAEFIRVAPGAKDREGAHGDHDWETVSADD
ncbi:guanosine monophosphate reductase [Halapricum hydrolyticum]|uniref:Guanosine monophosphate reductase n=1 Tax=Halapricum hydrolyticum TaxID=2979991 RepID=A0AAE3ICS6_9EURY|nr:guanosine monophosphate reductase [Halapricum hydrolyticum]MCU4718765.1 guanosine monophosphate reductase [Halapricum hydrolyticum]MCU4727752.1 guanosine monophosphate reductase [Halapricum hydrolyticum]